VSAVQSGDIDGRLSVITTTLCKYIYWNREKRTTLATYNVMQFKNYMNKKLYKTV